MGNCPIPVELTALLLRDGIMLAQAKRLQRHLSLLRRTSGIGTNKLEAILFSRRIPVDCRHGLTLIMDIHEVDGVRTRTGTRFLRADVCEDCQDQHTEIIACVRIIGVDQA